MTNSSPQRIYMIILFLFLALGTDGVSGQESTRSFAMGMAYWPPFGALTSEDVLHGDLDRLLRNTDVVLVQVPWCPRSSLPVPEAEWMSSVARAEWMISVARESNKQVMLAVDWLMGSRTEVRCGETTSWNFADDETAAEFGDVMSQLAEIYRPEYMLLGVEVDYYATIEPNDFPNFVTTYRTARDEIATISPGTKVGVSLQFEHMIQTRGAEVAFVINMIQAFGRSSSDFLGLSTYPFTAGVEAAEFDASYFEGIENQGIPIVLTETGWPTADVGIAEVTSVVVDDRSQERYMDNLLRVSQELEFSLVMWVSLRDAVFSELDVGTSPWAAYVALWDFSGNPKPALGVWRSWLTRPVNSTRY